MALKYVRCLENIGIQVANLLTYYYYTTNALSPGIDIDNFGTMFYIIIYIIYIIQCNVSMINIKI